MRKLFIAIMAALALSEGHAADGFVQAGTIVTASEIATTGEDCWFSAELIGDSVWALMQGRTFKPNPNIGRDDLRYVRTLHWNLDGQTVVGELVCNKLIANHLVEIFHELWKAHYPIGRMVLADNYDADDERQMTDNNTSCFCYRVVSGSRKLSKHALGLAVDLNTLYNPYVRARRDGSLWIQPEAGKPYVDRHCQFPCKITHDDLAYRLFTAHGFSWGGNWRTMKDYQHFEYNVKP